MKNSVLYIVVLFCLTLFSCKTDEKTNPVKKVVRKSPKTIVYTLQNTKDWMKVNKLDSLQQDIVLAINRTDELHLNLMDSIVVPTDLSGDLVFYLPFPHEAPFLNDVDKVIYFSYPTQTFAAYEKGILVRTGPTNMGRKKDLTPTGLFFTNWKAETTNSTFNDEWELKWNFNIENKLGVGFHQYDLPGYPASHSCLRLREKDAQYLYNWADEWILENDQKVMYKGTPVVVFGAYNFDAPKPWLQLVGNPKALAISVEELEQQTQPFLKKIRAEQQKK
ncbi:L,D-transpeptidase [Flavobacterium sp.]|uniref:L,D-transpeptidase n=1 Tax=Flavobacterium sp. TaxID=239 RepID=UPI002B4B6C3B|nr:L,D-transpeptidase [Flavobacterium sp.]HLP65140.1 L,D-transpeptidase [Flavobacterium sp.]